MIKNLYKNQASACLDRTSSSIDVYNRAQLDRRRLEDAHLKYSILQVYRRYPKHFTEWCISASVSHTLDEITPTFFTAFSQRYACKFILAVRMHKHLIQNWRWRIIIL